MTPHDSALDENGDFEKMVDIELAKKMVKDLRIGDVIALDSAREYCTAIEDESKSNYERITLAKRFLESLVIDFKMRAEIMTDLHKILNDGVDPNE